MSVKTSEGRIGKRKKEEKREENRKNGEKRGEKRRIWRIEVKKRENVLNNNNIYI